MNLIKRLRNYMPDGPDGSVHTEAAERIKELETELHNSRLVCGNKVAELVQEIKSLVAWLDALETWASQFSEDFKKRTAYPLEQKDG